MRIAWTATFLLAAAVMGAAPSAVAHGGIPRAYSIFFEPGQPDHIVLRSSLWGLFQSRDGGNTWSWTCSEAFGGRSLTYEHRSLVLLPGGTVLIAAQFGGLQVAGGGDLCDFVSHPAFLEDESTGQRREVVADVTAVDPQGSLLHVLTSTGGEDGVVVTVWRSADQAATWERIGTPLPGHSDDIDFSGSSMAVAPSDTNRLYVAGKYIGLGADGVVQRSLDGGETWEAFSVPVGMTDSWTGRLTAVHPEDPDVLYLWVDKTEGGGGDIQPDQFWMSTDGAQSWNRIYSAIGDLPGFTLSPDRTRVAIAGPEDGLLVAPARGGGPFEQVFSGAVWGLRWTEEGLYAGNNDFTPGDQPKFTFGVSQDDGATFSGLMEICQADIIPCETGSRTAAACASRYTDPGYYRDDYIEGPRCVGPSAPDAGGSAGTGGEGSGAATGDNGSSTGGGCGCAVPGRAAGSSAIAVLLGVAALRRLRRRSR
jgi:MYXO-CTERM domain-containing protein